MRSPDTSDPETETAGGTPEVYDRIRSVTNTTGTRPSNGAYHFQQVRAVRAAGQTSRKRVAGFAESVARMQAARAHRKSCAAPPPSPSIDHLLEDQDRNRNGRGRAPDAQPARLCRHDPCKGCLVAVQTDDGEHRLRVRCNDCPHTVATRFAQSHPLAPEAVHQLIEVLTTAVLRAQQRPAPSRTLSCTSAPTPSSLTPGQSPTPTSHPEHQPAFPRVTRPQVQAKRTTGNTPRPEALTSHPWMITSLMQAHPHRQARAASRRRSPTHEKYSTALRSCVASSTLLPTRTRKVNESGDWTKPSHRTAHPHRRLHSGGFPRTRECYRDEHSPVTPSTDSAATPQSSPPSHTATPRNNDGMVSTSVSAPEAATPSSPPARHLYGGSPSSRVQRVTVPLRQGRSTSSEPTGAQPIAAVVALPQTHPPPHGDTLKSGQPSMAVHSVPQQASPEGAVSTVGTGPSDLYPHAGEGGSSEPPHGIPRQRLPRRARPMCSAEYLRRGADLHSSSAVVPPQVRHNGASASTIATGSRRQEQMTPGDTVPLDSGTQSSWDGHAAPLRDTSVELFSEGTFASFRQDSLDKGKEMVRRRKTGRVRKRRNEPFSQERYQRRAGTQPSYTSSHIARPLVSSNIPLKSDTAPSQRRYTHLRLLSTPVHPYEASIDTEGSSSDIMGSADNDSAEATTDIDTNIHSPPSPTTRTTRNSRRNIPHPARRRQSARPPHHRTAAPRVNSPHPHPEPESRRASHCEVSERTTKHRLRERARHVPRCHRTSARNRTLPSFSTSSKEEELSFDERSHGSDALRNPAVEGAFPLHIFAGNDGNTRQRADLRIPSGAVSQRQAAHSNHGKEREPLSVWEAQLPRPYSPDAYRGIRNWPQRTQSHAPIDHYEPEDAAPPFARAHHPVETRGSNHLPPPPPRHCYPSAIPYNTPFPYCTTPRSLHPAPAPFNAPVRPPPSFSPPRSPIARIDGGQVYMQPVSPVESNPPLETGFSSTPPPPRPSVGSLSVLWPTDSERKDALPVHPTANRQPRLSQPSLAARSPAYSPNSMHARVGTSAPLIIPRKAPLQDKTVNTNHGPYSSSHNASELKEDPYSIYPPQQRYSPPPPPRSRSASPPTYLPLRMSSAHRAIPPPPSHLQPTVPPQPQALQPTNN